MKDEGSQIVIDGKQVKGLEGIYITFTETLTGILTNNAVDTVAKIPELKVCAVRVERNQRK